MTRHFIKGTFRHKFFNFLIFLVFMIAVFRHQLANDQFSGMLTTITRHDIEVERKSGLQDLPRMKLRSLLNDTSSLQSQKFSSSLSIKKKKGCSKKGMYVLGSVFAVVALAHLGPYFHKHLIKKPANETSKNDPKLNTFNWILQTFLMAIFIILILCGLRLVDLIWLRFNDNSSSDSKGTKNENKLKYQNQDSKVKIKGSKLRRSTGLTVFLKTLKGYESDKKTKKDKKVKKKEKKKKTPSYFMPTFLVNSKPFEVPFSEAGGGKVLKMLPTPVRKIHQKITEKEVLKKKVSEEPSSEPLSFEMIKKSNQLPNPSFTTVEGFIRSKTDEDSKRKMFVQFQDVPKNLKVSATFSNQAKKSSPPVSSHSAASRLANVISSKNISNDTKK